MKNLLLLFLGLCFAMPSFSQTKYSDYSLDYFSKTYDIKTAKPDNKGIFEIYIDIQCSEGGSNRTVNIIFDSDKIDAFRESIKQAREKYIEWRQVAIDNDVDKVSKNIDVKFPRVESGFIYGEWHFDFSVTLTSRFLVLEGSKYLMIIDTDKIVASDNEYMDTDGYIVFSNIDEIDSFLSKLDLAKMEEFITQKSSTESLFE